LLFIYQSWLGCDGFCFDNGLWSLGNNGFDGILITDYLDTNATGVDSDCVNLFGDYCLFKVQGVMHLYGVCDGECIWGT